MIPGRVGRGVRGARWGSENSSGAGAGGAAGGAGGESDDDDDLPVVVDPAEVRRALGLLSVEADAPPVVAATAAAAAPPPPPAASSDLERRFPTLAARVHPGEDLEMAAARLLDGDDASARAEAAEFFEEQARASQAESSRS